MRRSGREQWLQGAKHLDLREGTALSLLALIPLRSQPSSGPRWFPARTAEELCAETTSLPDPCCFQHISRGFSWKRLGDPSRRATGILLRNAQVNFKGDLQIEPKLVCFSLCFTKAVNYSPQPRAISKRGTDKPSEGCLGDTGRWSGDKRGLKGNAKAGRGAVAAEGFWEQVGQTSAREGWS